MAHFVFLPIFKKNNRKLCIHMFAVQPSLFPLATVSVPPDVVAESP